jgi:SdrD B-like domain
MSQISMLVRRIVVTAGAMATHSCMRPDTWRLQIPFFSHKRVVPSLLFGVLLGGSAAANITGIVYQDYNANGVRDTVTSVTNDISGGATAAQASNVRVAVDRGLAGITVTATCVTGLGADGSYGTADDVRTTYTAVTTDTTGAYTVDTALPAGSPTPLAGAAANPACRVSFAWNGTNALSGSLPNELFGMYPTFSASSGTNRSNTTTQFVDDGGSADLGLNYPADFCQNNPQLAVACQLYGAYNDIAIAANDSAIKGFRYNAKSIPTAQPSDTNPLSNNPAVATALALTNEIGATWGLAYHKPTGTLLASAHYKRHSGSGPLGLGGIYRISGGAGANFVDLNSLEVGAAGTDPRTGATYDYDQDQAVVVGGDLTISKRGIGDIDFSDDGNTLYAVGLASRKLYTMTVGQALITPTIANTTSVALPGTTTANQITGAAGCAVDDVRPFALKYYKGFVYVGLTCSAESTASNATLRAYVYRYDGSTFTQVLNETLNGAKFDDVNAGLIDWNYWSDAGDLSTNQRAEPLFADIEFDGTRMILGIRDRFGDVTSHELRVLDPTNATPDSVARVGSGRGHGQIYRACLVTTDAEAGTWTSAACGAIVGFDTYTTQYLGDTLTPAGPFDPNGPMGGLLQLPGYTDVVSSIKDPSQWYSNGVSWFGNSDGVITKGYELFDADTTAGRNLYGGKASGLGDVEALCDAAPLEVGNRIWQDLNGNGLQDAGEPPISNVTVDLYGPTGGLLGSAVTDADGNYYFSNKTVDENGAALPVSTSTINSIAGLTANTNGFAICLAASNFTGTGALVGFGITALNASGDSSNSALSDLLDSDMSLVNPTAPAVCAGFPSVTFATNNSGQNNFGLDAGFVPVYAIGNRVWNDNGVGTGGVAGDGIRNGTEPGLAGVTVELLSGTTVVGTTTTDGNGYYRFDGQAAGSYTVRITKPASFVNTTVPGTGSADNGTDNDNNGATDVATTVTSPTIVLGPGDSEAVNEADLVGGAAAGNAAANGGSDVRGNMTVDFGLRPATLSLGNRVWNDVNNNGLVDSGETGINDVIVYLYADADNNGTPDGAPVATQTTVGGGYYLFTGLSAGNYVVGVDPSTLPAVAGLAPFKSTTGQNGSATGPNEGTAVPDPDDTVADSDDNGTTATALNGASVSVPMVLSKTVTLALNTEPSGETDVGPQSNTATDTNTNLTVDFGFFRPASLGNFVWNDANANGVQDAGELGIQGVTVELYKNNVLVASTTTGTNGEYTFTNLIPGTDYTVDFVPVAGLIPSPQDQGGNDATDSDASATTGLTSAITLTSGQTRDDVDAGFFSTAGLGDRVWFDDNRNGQQDGGELGVQNVRVTLTTATGGTVTNTLGATVTPQNTDANGNYFFANLPPGSYIVTFDPTTLPAGYQFTTRGATGAKDATDSDPNTATGATETITLVSGEADRTWDAGIFKREIDLILAKAQAPVAPATGSPWLPGNLVQYTVVVTNAGPDDTQAGWTVTDNLPVGLINPTLVGVTPAAAGSCSFAANALSCNGLQGIRPATVVAGINDATLPATVSITYTAVIGPSASGSLVNSAQIAPNAADPAETIPLSATNTNNRDSKTLSLLGVASLGDRVWIDTNANGTQDSGEPGVVGVTVTLFDGSGTQVATTVTGANGVYSFTNLTPNTPYTVSLNNPANFAVGGPLANNGLTAPNVGGDDTIDSDATLVAGTPTISGATTGAAGSNTTTFDFGFVQPASLGNLVFTDTNGNGIQDAGEPGVPGVTVTVTNGAGAVVGTATTGPDGTYTVGGLPAGTYTVTFSTLPVGTQPTATGAPGSTPATDSNGLSSTVTLVAGQNDPTIDLGLIPVPPLPASLGNLVFTDTNGNGIQDAGEPGVPGVTVTVTNGAGAVVGTATTGPDGTYTVGGLPAGTYTVTFSTLPVGTQPTATGAPGSTPATDSNGLSSTVTLVAGQNDPTIDLGLIATPPVTTSVTGVVFLDPDRNGVKAPSEVGVPVGTVVNLVNPTTGAIVATTTTTDAAGNYTFPNVTPGNYNVVVPTPPGGTTATTPTTQPVTAVVGTTVRAPDIGFAPNAPVAAINGVVFIDPNRDGVKAPSEVGVPVGTVVNLVNPTTGAIVATTTTTDSAGNYTFPNVTPGNYNVVVPTPPGSTTATTPTTQPVTAVAGTTVRAPDIGFGPNTSGANVTGIVFFDPNRDGVLQTGEPAVSPGTVIQLRDINGVLIATTITNIDGSYTFPNVPPGTYTVTVIPPAGTSATTPLVRTIVVGTTGTTTVPDVGVTATAVPPAREIPTLSAFSLVALLLAMMGIVAGFQRRRRAQ